VIYHPLPLVSWPVVSRYMCAGIVGAFGFRGHLTHDQDSHPVDGIVGRACLALSGAVGDKLFGFQISFNLPPFLHANCLNQITISHLGKAGGP